MLTNNTIFDKTSNANDTSEWERYNRELYKKLYIYNDQSLLLQLIGMINELKQELNEIKEAVKK